MHNSFCVGSPEQMYNCTNYYYVSLFSVRHLGECWPHDSLFCVNVTPMHVFGNVQPKKIMSVQTQTQVFTTHDNNNNDT